MEIDKGEEQKGIFMAIKITKCRTCKKYNDITCQRCNHKWQPKSKDVKICPSCKSARFDKKKEV